MDVHSVGLTTELGLAATSGRILDRGDYLVVTLPDEPNYYFGNYLVLRAPPAASELASWTRVFAHEIGIDARIRHVTLRWDGITGAIEPAAVAALTAAGFAIEQTWVMTATEVSARPVAGDPIEIRPLELADMATVAALDLTLADRHDEPFRQFLQRRALAKRRLVERKLACWWGAFDRTRPVRDALVGSLGVVPLASVARYQDVQTATSHRRRGIASALLAAAARGHATLVIIADPESAAARVYGRAGFAVAERIASACRAPLG